MKFLIAIAALACVATASVIITPYGIIPALPERLELNDTGVITLDNSIATGTLELRKTVIVGLNTVTDNFKLNLISLDVKGTAQAVKVRVTTEFTIDVQLHSKTIGETHVVGNGQLEVTVEGITLDLSADFKLNIITQILSLRSINVLPKITVVSELTATGVTADGEPIDAAAVAKDLPGVIDKYFAENGESFNKEIVEVIDEVLAQHTLAEWLKIIGQS